MYFSGVDIGSTCTKIVILNKNEELCSRVVGQTGAGQRRLANEVMEKALEQANLILEDMCCVVATGYGRFNVPFADYQITELTCHAKGVFWLFPSTRTAIDIGGQDTKALKVDKGQLVQFVMNDKCAAGTGRFLEVLANALGLKVEDLGEISVKTTNKVKINNICTFFARQEIISCISEGLLIEDIVAGLHDAIANRVVSLVKRLKIEPDIVLTGGVAKNGGIVRAIEEKLNYGVFVPKDPLVTGALGAALLAKEFTMSAMRRGETLNRKGRVLEEVGFFK